MQTDAGAARTDSRESFRDFNAQTAPERRCGESQTANTATNNENTFRRHVASLRAGREMQESA
jgi:hypothetical protein